MSKFDLRDISERITGSTDLEALVFEFLGYLQSLHPDWNATLAFYEVSHDAIERVYERRGDKLVRRDVSIPVEQLPARLVRKFFHPSAFFEKSTRRSLFSHLLRTSPFYEPEASDRAALAPFVPIANWQSCVCMPLLDREDVLALLVVASEKKNALAGKMLDEVLPVKSIAALALAQHLYRSERKGGAGSKVPLGEFQERVHRLSLQTRELEEDNKAKTERLETLGRELEAIDRNSSEYRQELERVKGTILALEEQTMMATQHLNDAYTQLNVTQTRLDQLETTIAYMKDTFDQLGGEYAAADISRNAVAIICKRFGIERCSLMTVDPSGQTLTIAAQRGVDPEVAARVKVRIGQGIAGWVAHNRKPLMVRVPEEAPGLPRQVGETYNSDSFICVPLIHCGTLHGVLSLSNKRDGEPFDAVDLDRTALAAGILAMVLSSQNAAGANEEGLGAEEAAA